MSCLLVASLNSSYMQSEVQELSNNLQRGRYLVHLLQTGITSLELYRTLDQFPMKRVNLVWIAGHASEKGFHFDNTLITPRELGMFLAQAKSRDVVLNTCHSIEHVTILQRHANVNIVATLNPEIEDAIAWTQALYLGRRLAETRDLFDAYQEVMTADTSDYRWFPAPKVERANRIAMEEKPDDWEEVIRTVERLDSTVGRLLRALQGDRTMKQKGLIDWVDELQKRMETIEQRQLNQNKLNLTRFDLGVVIGLFILVLLGIVYLTYILGGYNFDANVHFTYILILLCFYPSNTR